MLQAILKELPGEPLIYLADQAHVPYGPRPLEEVRLFADEITRFLLSKGAKCIVVACNAASAAALQQLRKTFPEVPFVGMEPAVKPAVEHSESKVVAVLATPATFQGALYASVVERFATGVELLQDTCQGLVIQIESGDLTSSKTRLILEKALIPMLARGADTVVLGCTHYPFVIPLIQEICGPEVRVIDPAPAVARQVRRILALNGLLSENESPSKRPVEYSTTGDPQRFRQSLAQMIGVESDVIDLHWDPAQQELRTSKLPDPGWL